MATHSAHNKKSDRAKNVLLAFDWYDHRVFKGIVKHATEAGWHLSPYLFSVRFVPYGWPADGAITCCGKELKKFILSLNMPKVDISVVPLEQPIPRVTVDDAEVGRMAARHFLERGFTQFAYYSWPIIPVNQLRMTAFFDALREEGVASDSLFKINQPPAKTLGDWNRHQSAILSQLRNLPRPLAVFAGQDNLGAILIEICVRNGIHVPEEIAVLGVDNTDFMCDCLPVPMSSIDTRLEELGYQAAQQLERLMNKELRMNAEPQLLSPLRVVTRQSTDILAVEHPAVVKALRFIKDHLDQPITIDDIGQHVGMSKRGVEKAFMKHLRRSPASELRMIRLNMAKRLLTETDDKIEFIAVLCGYSNSSNLSFAFNRDTGMSPCNYRKMYRNATEQH